MMSERPITMRIDELYGEIAFSQEEIRIINTPEIQRLSDISLSAVPPITLGVQIPSRLEHSIGVAHLAKIVAQKGGFEKYSRELFVAGIAHDVGSPPFSHIGERFLHKMFGMTHERFAEKFIMNSQLSRELEDQGISVDTVVRLINGQLKPISDVIAGTLDVDNLDNIPRYAKAMGIIETPLFSGEHLANSFTFNKGRVALEAGSEDELNGWLESRHRIYQYVYSAKNQVMGAMTRRALQFAYEADEIKEEFFYWTDTKAYDFLLHNCNPKTRKISTLAANKQPYHTVTDLVTTNPSQELLVLSKDSDNRETVADSIASAFSIPREDVCIYFGKSRNYRSVHLPIINKAESETINGIKQEWTAQAFLNPEHASKFEGIDSHFRDQLGLAG